MHGMRLTGRLLGCRVRQRAFFVFGMDVLLKLDLAETREFFAAFFALSDFHWQGFLSARLTFPQAPRLLSHRCTGFRALAVPAAPWRACMLVAGVAWMWRCFALLSYAHTPYLLHGPA